MSATIVTEKMNISRWMAIGTIVIGSAFLALMSQVSFHLPFTPVPLTLQSFAVLILAGVLGAKRSVQSIMLYLFEGTCGLPVFAGGAFKPLWFTSYTAGYLIAFLISAYAIGKILERQKNPSFGYYLAAFTLGTIIIHVLGSIWLAYFIGFNNAWAMGSTPFIPGSVLKILAAASLFRGWSLTKRALA